MTPKEKELADNAYLLRGWKKYRAEELSDDPLWDAPLNAFLRIRERINQFPAPLQERPTRRGPYPGANHE